MRIITNRTDNYPELNIYVDDEDFDRLNQFQWCIVKNMQTYYATAHVSINGVWTKLYIHRLVMGLSDDNNMLVDHIDGNGLNNIKSNLRIVTPSENSRNRMVSSRNTSGIVGVSWNDKQNQWRVQIIDNQNKIKTKSFSANKYGFEEAKSMAISQRKEWEIEFGYNVRY